MKKRLVALALSLVLMLTIVSPAVADDGFDISYIRKNDKIFEISVNDEEEIAFITTVISVADRSFTHEYESKTRYSYLESDILVLDYYSDNPEGILRTWIVYSADEFLYITSVSFFVNGKEYIFSGIADSEWHYEFDDGIMEKVLIKYGAEGSADFLDAVIDEGIKSNDDENYSPEIKMVLHGTKDVTVNLGRYPILDLTLITLTWVMANGTVPSTPSTLKVVDAN